MSTMTQIDDVGLPLWIFLIAGLGAMAVACLLRAWKNLTWWTPLFYFPAVAVGVSLLASFEMVRPFGWDRPASNGLALAVLYLAALAPYALLKRAVKTEAEIKAEQARADRVLVTAMLLRGKEEDHDKAVEYIRSSDLTRSEKKRALEMLEMHRVERADQIRKNLEGS